MNNLKPLTTNVLGGISQIFDQGMQKSKEWAGHVVRYFKQVPELLAQHPNAAAAVIATTNVLFILIINHAITELEKGKANPNSTADDRNYVQMARSASLVAVSTVAFNIFLSYVTKMPLNSSLIAVFSAMSVGWHFFAKYLSQSQDSQATQNKPLDPQKVKIRITNLEYDISQFKIKAGQHQTALDELNGQIAAKNKAIVQLESFNDSLGEEKDKAVKSATDAKRERDQLANEKGTLLTQKADLEKDLEKVRTELKQTLASLTTEKADRQREHALIQQKATDSERDLKAQLAQATAASNDAATKLAAKENDVNLLAAAKKKAEDTLRGLDKLHRRDKAASDQRIIDLTSEIEALTGLNDQLRIDLDTAELKITGTVQRLQGTPKQSKDAASTTVNANAQATNSDAAASSTEVSLLQRANDVATSERAARSPKRTPPHGRLAFSPEPRKNEELAGFQTEPRKPPKRNRVQVLPSTAQKNPLRPVQTDSTK